MQLSLDFSAPLAQPPICAPSVKQRQGATSYAAGLLAEEAVEQDLVEAGHRVLDRRARMSAGEIDLISQDNGTIVFTEIKQRRTLDEAAHALSAKQIHRIGQAALEWLSSHDLDHFDIRFDAALVDRQGRREIRANALDFSPH
ncbi:MAG: YraN family protein [Pseudomonadota bacterium]